MGRVPESGTDVIEKGAVTSLLAASASHDSTQQSWKFQWWRWWRWWWQCHSMLLLLSRLLTSAHHMKEDGLVGGNGATISDGRPVIL